MLSLSFGTQVNRLISVHVINPLFHGDRSHFKNLEEELAAATGYPITDDVVYTVRSVSKSGSDSIIRIGFVKDKIYFGHDIEYDK